MASTTAPHSGSGSDSDVKSFTGSASASTHAQVFNKDGSLAPQLGKIHEGDNDGESFDQVPIENRRISTFSAVMLIANRMVSLASVCEGEGSEAEADLCSLSGLDRNWYLRHARLNR